MVVQLTLSSLHISFWGAAAAGGISKKKKKDDTNLIGYEPKNMDDVVFIITEIFFIAYKTNPGWVVSMLYTCKTTTPVATSW